MNGIVYFTLLLKTKQNKKLAFHSYFSSAYSSVTPPQIIQTDSGKAGLSHGFNLRTTDTTHKYERPKNPKHHKNEEHNTRKTPTTKHPQKPQLRRAGLCSLSSRVSGSVGSNAVALAATRSPELPQTAGTSCSAFTGCHLRPFKSLRKFLLVSVSLDNRRGSRQLRAETRY